MADSEGSSSWANKPHIMQAARDLLAALSRGEGQQALDRLPPLQLEEVQAVAWALGNTAIAASRSGGLADEDLLRAFDQIVEDSITEEVQRGLDDLD